MAARLAPGSSPVWRSEEHTSELQSPCKLGCRLLLEKKRRQVRVLVPRRQTARIQMRPAHRPADLRVVEPGSLFLFNDTATPEIYTLSLHDALPIYYGDHRVAADGRMVGEQQDRLTVVRHLQ